MGRARAAFLDQWPVLLLVVAAAAGTTALAPLAAVVTDDRIGALELLGDPAEVAGIPWYVGAITTVNLLVWGAGATLYLVAGVGARRRERGRRGSPRLGNGLLWLGGLTLVMLLDDRFLLHEIVLPWVLDVPQLVTFALYGLALVLVLVRYRSVLFVQPEGVLLALGVVALGTSVGLDVVGWDSLLRRILEEGAKLLGATAWSVYPAALVLRWLAPPAATERAGHGPAART